MEDDAFEDIGSAAARVVKGVAPAGGGPASAAQAGTGETRRADHDGGGTAVILEFKCRPSRGAREPAPQDLFEEQGPGAPVTPLRVRTKLG